MRATHLCPKCSANRILHLTQVADRIGETGDPLAAGAGLERGPIPDFSRAFRIARIPLPEKERRWYRADDATAGLVEAYVCKACGFTELYTRDPESIPADGEIVRELVGPEKPYR